MLKSTVRALQSMLDRQRILTLAVQTAQGPVCWIAAVRTGARPLGRAGTRVATRATYAGPDGRRPCRHPAARAGRPGQGPVADRATDVRLHGAAVRAQEPGVGSGPRAVPRAFPRQPHHLQARRLHALPLAVRGGHVRRRLWPRDGHRIARHPATRRDQSESGQWRCWRRHGASDLLSGAVTARSVRRGFRVRGAFQKPCAAGTPRPEPPWMGSRRFLGRTPDAEAWRTGATWSSSKIRLRRIHGAQSSTDATQE